jgi:hypothetical protein
MSQTRSLREKTKRQVFHYLEPSVGTVASMSLEQLQQFAAGTFHPTDDQITRLARRMRLV